MRASHPHPAKLYYKHRSGEFVGKHFQLLKVRLTKLTEPEISHICGVPPETGTLGTLAVYCSFNWTNSSLMKNLNPQYLWKPTFDFLCDHEGTLFKHLFLSWSFQQDKVRREKIVLRIHDKLVIITMKSSGFLKQNCIFWPRYVFKEKLFRP